MEKNSIWITGAGKGIGKALTEHFAKKGFRVIATDMSFSPVKNRREGVVTYLQQDVGDYTRWQELIKELKDTCELPYYLINNAGVCFPGYVHVPNEEEINLTMKVNSMGLIYGTTLMAEAFVSRGFGHIINVASLAGITPTAGLAVYSASKFAARGYTLSAAMELNEHGIAVTAICPDAVDTPMLQGMSKREASSMAFSSSRLLQTHDIVKAVEKAMKSRAPEITLPTGRAFLAKLAGFNLKWVWGLKSSLTKKGEKKRQDYLK